MSGWQTTIPGLRLVNLLTGQPGSSVEVRRGDGTEFDIAFRELKPHCARDTPGQRPN